ncbi:MAG: ABC transporter permease [Deltaproteobacteria bacterium]|jgi:spermidine/putrescine transport system permease protein|nr:ABC transporter permease [Deltaproteobacteria bacterium]
MERKRPIVALMAFISIALLYIPALAVAVFSVNDARYGLNWRGFTLKWYKLLLENDYIAEAAVNSLVLAVVSTLLATVMGTALALGLDRTPWPRAASKAADLVINIPVVIPDVIMAVALTMAFSFLRLLSPVFDMGMLTLIIGHVTFQISFVTLVVRSRLASLNRETDEAARDLFASDLYLFRRVTLPLIMPGVLAGAMLAFTLSLDDFIISFFTHGPESVTLPIFIYASIKRGLTPEIHALSTLMLLFTVVLVIIAERLSRKF